MFDFLLQHVSTVIDFFLHLDVYLEQALQSFGYLTYLLLFLVIFCETGLVVTPILPGDSLLFAAGALTTIPSSPLNVHILFILLFIAAVLGDALNYKIGYSFSHRLFASRLGRRFIKQEYITQTEQFYLKHGGKTIILARFIPIIRTFAPFVAGMSKMPYKKFFHFNVVGGFVWVASFCYMGHFLGNIPIVKKNTKYLVLAIIIVSVIPAFIEFFKMRRAKKSIHQTISENG